MQKLDRLLKLGTKNALFGSFGEQFWKAIALFVISAPELVQKSLKQSLVEKEKSLNLGLKMPNFQVFGLKFENYCHNWNQYPQICLFLEFGFKIKIL